MDYIFYGTRFVIKNNIYCVNVRRRFMEKLKGMWGGLKTSLKIFIVIVACILAFALINNIFN